MTVPPAFSWPVVFLRAPLAAPAPDGALQTPIGIQKIGSPSVSLTGPLLDAHRLGDLLPR